MPGDYYLLLEFDMVDNSLDMRREIWYVFDLRTGENVYISLHIDEDMVVA
jgi:hypothetical protein